MIPNNSYNPAFPFHIKLRNKAGEEPFRESVSYGLTKRELFAMMAMQGILSDSGRSARRHDEWAKDAVRLADELIKELEKETK